MKRVIVALFVIVFICISGAYFIDKKETNLASNTIDESINYSVFELPNDMQSIHNLSNSDVDIICATSKGLVSKNENNEIIPELASEFKVSSDKIQYEFKIKDDIYWSDGSKITCEDITDFFRQLIKEENEEEVSALLNVYNAQSYRDEKVKYFKSVAIKANGDTIVMRLNSSSNDFLEELTKPQYRIRKNIILWGNLRRNYKDLIYSGDYNINDINSNSVVLKKNNENCKFSIINMIKEPNAEKAMASYEINLTDIVIDPPSSVLNKLKDKDSLVTINQNKGNYIFINDNTGISLDGRRAIYNLIYKAIEEYHATNTSDFELAEACYFREEKNNLIQMQSRKVETNTQGTWDKPKVLTIIGQDTKINRTLCRSISDYFSNNTDITIKYSLVNEEEFKNKELKKRYDMILISDEANCSNKEEFYTNLEEYLTKLNLNILEETRVNDYYGEYSKLENSIFDNYNVLPLCFENKNIALSSKISSLDIDSYGNLKFSD